MEWAKDSHPTLNKASKRILRRGRNRKHKAISSTTRFPHTRETMENGNSDEDVISSDQDEEVDSIFDLPGAHRVGRCPSMNDDLTPTIIEENQEINHQTVLGNDTFNYDLEKLVIAELAETPEMVVGTAVKTIPVWKNVLICLFVVIVVATIVITVVVVDKNPETKTPIVDHSAYTSTPTMSPTTIVDRTKELLSAFLVGEESGIGVDRSERCRID